MARRVGWIGRRSLGSSAVALACLVFVVGTGGGRGSIAGDRAAPTGADVGRTCSVLPRSFAEIQTLRESDVVADDPLPPDAAGVQAVPAVRAEIVGIVRAFLGCSAAGEPLRVWTLYSDGYLARLLGRERGYDRARYDADLIPLPLESADRPVLRSVSSVTAFGNDRAMARIAIWYPNLGREKALDCWFARDAGAWRIDEIDGEITFSLP